METLQDIFDYTNKLLNDDLTNITDVIEYINEAQNKIAEIDKIEETYLVSITGDKFALPPNFLSMVELKIDDVIVSPLKVWGGYMYLEDDYTGGTLEMMYYKKPAQLTTSNLTATLEVDNRYYYAIGQYAAEMHRLMQGDLESVEAFRDKFFSGLKFKKSKTSNTRFKNIW